MTSARRLHGQALVEYIMIIGLIVIFIIAALFYFRDAVNEFTGRISDWIDGASTPPGQTSPPSMAAAPGPTPAPQQPPPSSAPPPPNPAMTDDDWVNWLVGTWCSSGNNVVYSRAGPGLITLYRVYPDGRRSPSQTVRITSLGNDGYRETLQGGTFWGNQQRLSPDSFRIVSRADGYSQSGSFTRCG